jgi:O-antigen ligase
MTFLVRNLVLLHVLLLAFALTWVHGGTRVDHLRGVVPGLTIMLVSALIALPPQRKGETAPEARRRVLLGVLRDPLLYIGLFLTALLVLQWANGGRVLGVNAQGQPELGLPPWPDWPSSVDPRESVQQLYWFPPVFVALLAVRHGVTRLGRRRLLLALVWGGAALSVFGWIQHWTGTTSLFWLTPLPSRFFATFGYENHAGAFFTLLFAISGGIWYQAAMDPEETLDAWRLLIPTALNLAGVFGSLSRAAMLLSLVILVGGGLACLVAAWGRTRPGTCFKAVTYALLAVLVVVGMYFAFPRGTVRTELETVRFAQFYEDTIGARIFQYRSAWAIAGDHPFFGVGGWGYRHFAQFYVTHAEMEAMVAGKGMANVHNDFLQFLAEHGAIGLVLLLAAVGALLAPILAGAWKLWRTPPLVDWDNPFVPVLLRVPATVYAVLLGTTATVVQSLIDLPFRSPAILLTWALCLACAPAFLPRPQPATAQQQQQG